jgi:hypothetical protein
MGPFHGPAHRRKDRTTRCQGHSWGAAAKDSIFNRKPREQVVLGCLLLVDIRHREIPEQGQLRTV